MDRDRIEALEAHATAWANAIIDLANEIDRRLREIEGRVAAIAARLAAVDSSVLIADFFADCSEDFSADSTDCAVFFAAAPTWAAPFAAPPSTGNKRSITATSITIARGLLLAAAALLCSGSAAQAQGPPVLFDGAAAPAAVSLSSADRVARPAATSADALPVARASANPATQRERIEALEAWRASIDPWRSGLGDWQRATDTRLAALEVRAGDLACDLVPRLAAIETRIMLEHETRLAAIETRITLEHETRLAAIEARLAALEGPHPPPQPGPQPSPSPDPTPDPPTPDQPAVGPAARPLAECTALAEPIEVAGDYTLAADYRFAGDALRVTGDCTIRLAGHTIYYGTAGQSDSCGLRSDSYQVGRIEVIGPGWILAPPASGVEIWPPRAQSPTSGGAVENCHAVFVPRGRDGLAVSLADVVLSARGRDAACVRIPYGQVSLVRVLAVCQQTSTADRHSRPANVWCPQASLAVDQCVLIGGNSGIVAAHNHQTVGGRSSVRRSLVSVDQFATNGYAVSQGIVEDCVLASPTAGRGVIFESPRCELRRNVVLAWDRPNAEFGDPLSLDGPGVRIRHYGPSARNHAHGCIVEQNHVLSVGGGDYCQAAALFLSTRPAAIAGGPPLAEQYQTVRGNVFESIRLPGGNEKIRCRAVSLEGQGFWANPDGQQLADYGLPVGPGVPCLDVIDGNTFRSNQYLLSTTGSDNSTGCDQRRPMTGNAWGWTDGQAARLRWLLAAREKLAATGLGTHPNAVARLDAVARALDVLDTAPLLPLGATGSASALATGGGGCRYTWSTGLWGPGERCELRASSTTEDSAAPVTWTEADASPSDRPTERVLVVGGADVRAR